MFILALGHELGVGKDTLAMYILNYYRLEKPKLAIHKQGFADKLYEICFNLYEWGGFRRKVDYDRDPKLKEIILPKLNRTPRDILIGTGEAIRVDNPRAFVDPVVLDDRWQVKIVTDMRNEQEFSAVCDMGGFAMKVAKPGYVSERKMDTNLRNAPWHETCWNDGTLHDLNRKAIEICERIINPKL